MQEIRFEDLRPGDRIRIRVRTKGRKIGFRRLDLSVVGLFTDGSGEYALLRYARGGQRELRPHESPIWLVSQPVQPTRRRV